MVAGHTAIHHTTMDEIATALEIEEGDEIRGAFDTSMEKGVGAQFRGVVESVDSEQYDRETYVANELLMIFAHNPKCSGDGDVETFRITMLRYGDTWKELKAEGGYWNGAEYEWTQSNKIVALHR